MFLKLPLLLALLYAWRGPIAGDLHLAQRPASFEASPAEIDAQDRILFSDLAASRGATLPAIHGNIWLKKIHHSSVQPLSCSIAAHDAVQ